MVQGMKADVVDSNGDGSDQNRQPVAIEGQHGEKHEDAEVYFNLPMCLIDVQRGHDHQPDADAATHQSSATDDAIQPGQHQRGATTDHNGLGKRIKPEPQAQRVHKQQPDQAQHDAVGLTVMLKETRGCGHRTHPYEIGDDREARSESGLDEQKPGQRTAQIVAPCHKFRNRLFTRC